MPNETTFTISPARSRPDVDDVRSLMEAYAAALGVDLSYQGFAAELVALPGPYAPPRGALLLARGNDGRAVGCVALRPMLEAGCCEMKRLYVGDAARGTGLGRRLAEAIMAEGARLGYREMRLDTLPGMTEAIALYRSLGFAAVAPYYQTPIEGTIFLGRTLPRTA